MVDPIRHLFFAKLVIVLWYFDQTSAAVVQQCSAVCDFYEWGRDARCQGRNLGAVPQECMQAKTLRMQDNQLSRLAPGTFENFTRLKYLYLERNNMTVETGSFRGCAKLENVHLNQNHLPVLTEGIWAGMPATMYMFIDNASVCEIQPEAFVNLPHLKFLSLEDNQLTTPPCDAFGPNNTLNTLYLTGNSISYLPNNCFTSLSRLSKLYLRKNPLSNPNPLAFEGLDSLTLLDLQFTNLTEVPLGVFQQATNIEKLYLSYNNISRLSNRDFMSLHRLTHLHLQHNNIIFIQERSFEFLGPLHMLDLSFNRISYIKKNTLLGNVRDLKLQGNLLTSTKNISFESLPSYTKLHLAGNPLHCDCSMKPFLLWSEASVRGVHSDLHVQSLRCASPQEFTGRLILSLQLSDICPSDMLVTSESPSVATQSTPVIKKEERIQDSVDETSAVFPTIITITVVSITLVIIIVIVCGIKQQIIKRKSKRFQASEIGSHVSSKPLKPDISRDPALVTSSSPFLPRQTQDDPYYLSIDGDTPCRPSNYPSVDSFRERPLHHPMPPRFSSETDLTLKESPTFVCESSKNGIIYSRALPDGQLQSSPDNGIHYTSVLPDDDGSKSDQEQRPSSMISEVSIKEWVRNNCSFDSLTISNTVDDVPVPDPIRKIAGSPYVTIVSQSDTSQLN